MIITNGVVHTMDGPVIDRGYVAFEEGKITAVGPMEELPAAWAGRSWTPRGDIFCPD